jgi:hypothetical protein
MLHFRIRAALLILSSNSGEDQNVTFRKC